MQKVFIVRPFGVKEGVDFDAIDAALIQPALASAGLQGSTTAEIVEAGNIREDMFRLLVTADLVVADLSIHNANVFYELGIRHGLCPRATFMLRANVHQFPFDLQTDRYLAYDPANPAASVDELARSLKATVDSRRNDSPVYNILPNLKAPDPAVLKVVASDFREEVERARADLQRGDLRLLAYEARSFDWATEGLRIVGRAQFKIKAWAGAKETFEWLLELQYEDIEASQRLGTIYQRLGDLPRSNQVIENVIDSPDADREQRTEAFALRARNTKAMWRASLAAVAATDLRATALRAPELAQAVDSYATGYALDLNHYYSGLNALALLSIRIELARALPDVWSAGFDSDGDAASALALLQQQFVDLSGAVHLALASARDQIERQDSADEDERLWLRISEADFAFLTARRPAAVAQRYREALVGGTDFAVSSARDQLEMFLRLDVRSEFASAALAAIPLPSEANPGAPRKRALLFTGHMVDASGRKVPRFPNTKQAEAEARRLIRAAVVNEQALAPEGLIGIAAGASGGDILLHDVCAELGIESRLFLALPRPQFCAASVEPGGPDWVERYNQLCQRIAPRVLSESEQLPRWLRGKKDYGIWQRNNLWMLFNALALNPDNLTLIALWDGGEADGPGGTQDLIREVKLRGHKNIVIPAAGLKDLADN